MFNAYLSNTLHYDPEKCIHCGMCILVCPHGVFSSGDGAARLLHRESCMECGACALNCPVDAIAVESGVGCAAAMIKAALTGSKEPTCGCAGSSCCSDEG